MLEYPSQLIPHRIEESIQLLWSVDLNVDDVFRWAGDVEPLWLRQIEERHNWVFVTEASRDVLAMLSRMVVLQEGRFVS